MMPKLQILLGKGKVTFNNNNKRKRFRVLNFPRAAILDFMMSLRCLYCWKAEVLLFETIGQRSDVINVTFPLPSKICNLGIIWSNLGSTHASSRGSL